ncbi:MAG: chemotaxis protein CheX [Acidobacteria bacterium]|nr:chemotaxis protein CheX [Acidobacteriota bacterium]
MQPNDIQTALVSAVEEVLGTMCFTSVLASAEGDAPPEGDAGAPDLTAELHFQGRPSGGFRVGVPRSLARVVGAGFLGREEIEVSDSQAEEVIRELANMICGSVLSRLESKTTIRISHPEPAPPERGVRVAGAAANRGFDLGDGILTVSMELQEAV